MECVKIQNKMKLLFQKFEDPKYVIDNYYADGLINKLASCDPEIGFLEKVPLISDLLISALDCIDTSHNSVKVFVIRVLAITAREELHFAKIFSKHGERISTLLKNACTTNTNPSVRVAFTEVALAAVNHISGITWLLETDVWKHILSLYDDKTTVFLVRQIDKFMTEFLWILNDFNDIDNIRIIIAYIINPITQTDLMALEKLSSEEAENICKKIEPSISVLLKIVSKKDRIKTNNILMSVIIKEHKIQSRLYIAFDILRKEDTCLQLTQLLFWLGLSKTFLTKPYSPGVQYNDKDFMELAASNFNIIQNYVQRRNANAVIEFCSTCYIIWNSVFKDQDDPIWCSSSSGNTKMKNQMLIICLTPIVAFAFITTKNATDEVETDYIMKLFDSSCEHTTKAAYVVRDLTLELDTLSVTLQSVKKLINLKDHLDDEQANLVFQALFYVLKDYNPIDSYGELKKNIEENYEDGEQKNVVMTYVMDSILSLVTDRNINWHESLEIVCLYNVVTSIIMRRSNLTCKFIVKALNVIALTVKKFLQPNLSLLVDSDPTSAIYDLGKLVYIKMQDRNWEIRDTALELLLVCTEISYIKFPPFRKQILDNNLINVAATIAFNDFEPYVQVSALKCIGAASGINVIWKHLTEEFPNILDRLLYILRNNDEGIVRKEACNVLCDLYRNLKVPSSTKQLLYEHMVSSAISDFHWEVQISALKFWKIVYQSLLTDQGMLDGTFPPVTFSKESRKIVNLNQAEIGKRLVKILDDLSAMGCLTVFVNLLQEGVELGILEVALTIAQELYNILHKYKVPENLKPKPGGANTMEEFLSNVEKEIPENDCFENPDVPNSENVIEDILNANDINLLANIYERHMNLDQSNVDTALQPKMKLSKVASPYLFVNYLKDTNFKEIIAEKRKWNIGIKSMSSLLDDILGLYEACEEVNSLDCY